MQIFAGADEHVGLVVAEVPAMHVINITVAIVVNAIAGDLARVGPDVGGEVFVGDVDAGIDDGNNHVIAAGGDVPGARRTDVCGRRAGGQAGEGIHQPPPAAEAR